MCGFRGLHLHLSAQHQVTDWRDKVRSRGRCDVAGQSGERAIKMTEIGIFALLDSGVIDSRNKTPITGTNFKQTGSYLREKH